MPYLKTTISRSDSIEELKIYVGDDPALERCYVKTKFLDDGGYDYRIYDGKSLIGHMRLHPDLTNATVCIDTMYNKSQGRYKRVGTALHEIAFKASIKLGYGGSVSLGAGYKSLLFHYACGFRCWRSDSCIFPWNIIQDQELGEMGYQQWNLSRHPHLKGYSPRMLGMLSRRTYNEVFEFYYDLYKKGDLEKQAAIQNLLASFGEIQVRLTSDMIEIKKKEYQVENRTDAVLPEPELEAEEKQGSLALS